MADAGGRPATIAEAGACDLVCVAVKPKDAGDVLGALAAAGRPGRGRAVGDRGLGPRPPERRGAGMPAGAHHAEPRGAPRRRASSPWRRAASTRRAPPASPTCWRRSARWCHLPEALFPAATALAGSGPGLVAVVAEGLEEGAVAAGLSRAQAREMVGAVLAGTAALLAGRDRPRGLLRQRVSSPAGHDDRRGGRP